MADWMPPPSEPPPYSAAMPPPSTPYPGDEAVYAGDDGPPAVARHPGSDQYGLPKKGLLGGVVLLWDDRGFGFLQVADGRRAYFHNSQCTNTDAKAVEKITADTPVFCLIAKDPKNFGFWAAKEVEIAVCTASPSLAHPHPIARMPHPYALLPCLMETSAGLPAV